MHNARATGRVLLEVCVETIDDAAAAAEGGADRVELNSALALDGLTPSPGLLIQTCGAVRVPVIAMARPRAGDFCYSGPELKALRTDAEFALSHGAAGFAFGILTENRRVDVRRCRDALRRTGGESVFHRAFDLVPDPTEALEQLLDLGVRRVMTSGGRRTAEDGASVLANLIKQAAGRIEILPAGGIRPKNVTRIIDRTACDQLHSSLRDKSGQMSREWLKELVRRTG